MSFHLIESSILKVTKVKLFSLVWKILRDNFQCWRHRLQSHFPSSPHFSLQLVCQKNLNQHCSTKPSPTITSLIACGLGLHYQQSGSLLACVQHKQTHNSAKTHQTLQQPHPLEFNQATPNAYQMIALCLCNNMTPSQTQTPLNLRETLSFERQG